jgi:hypothetical protein
MQSVFSEAIGVPTRPDDIRLAGHHFRRKP